LSSASALCITFIENSLVPTPSKKFVKNEVKANRIKNREGESREEVRPKEGKKRRHQQGGEGGWGEYLGY
jgi:hypothetical protein